METLEFGNEFNFCIDEDVETISLDTCIEDTVEVEFISVNLKTKQVPIYFTRDPGIASAFCNRVMENGIIYSLPQGIPIINNRIFDELCSKFNVSSVHVSINQVLEDYARDEFECGHICSQLSLQEL